MPQVMFTLPMAEMQPHGIGDAQCAPKERKDRKVCRASKARKFIFAFLSRVAICLQNEWREARPLVFEIYSFKSYKWCKSLWQSAMLALTLTMRI